MEGQPLLPGSAITLLFDEGKFYGSAGCNDYGGKYTSAPGGGFVLEEVELTAMLCEEPAGVMEQENRFIAALTSARRYITINKVLELVSEGEEAILKFDLMPTFKEMTPEILVGKNWQLVSAPGLEKVNVSAFTIHFDGERFSGTTVCREYAGTYTAEMDRLRIGFLEMTTDVDCEENLLMAEGWYTTLLENAEQYHVINGHLELYTLKGEEIIFEQETVQE
jgi:heat shock protein HslJ